MSLFDLSDEVAVVIGATGVLGGAMASGLAGAGARVAVLGRNEARGKARVDAIRKQGGTAAFFRADAVNRAAWLKPTVVSRSSLAHRQSC